MTDDWKGEHLIRARKANPGEDIRRLMGAGEAVARKREANICAVPGCGRKLSIAATTGVCSMHRHSRGYCNCAKCERNRAKRESE